MDKTIPRGAAMLLDFIRDTETGTDGPRSYETIFGHNQDKIPKPVTQMTLGEIQAAQGSWSRRFGSSATGGYQFMKRTLAGLIKELGLRSTQILDSDLQDRLGFHLLKRRGYNEFASGRIDTVEFAKRLAMEWASFPVLRAARGAHRDLKRGQSYYAGDGLNKALVSPEKIETLLKDVRQILNRQTAEKPLPAPVPRPEIDDPENLDKPMAKSKTFWMWLSTAIGAPAAAFAGLDWRVQLALVALIVGFAVYGIYARHRISKIYREIKAGL